MKLTKYAKAFILGLCVAVSLSTAAFAETGGKARQVEPVPADARIVDSILIESGGASESFSGTGQGQTGVVPAQEPFIDSGLLERQREIDEKVFKTHAQELMDKGIRVTHTGPMDGYVEVGISPYSEESANYLYELLGKDMIKIVEGHQAVLLVDGGPDAPDASVSSPAVGRAPADGTIMPYVAEPYVAEDAIAENSSAGASEQIGEARVLAANDSAMEVYALADNTSSTWSPTQIIAIVLPAAAAVILGCAVLIRRKRNAVSR